MARLTVFLSSLLAVGRGSAAPIGRQTIWLRPARVLCLSLLVVPACGGSSPTAPDALSAAGTWAGTHEILTCQGGVDFRSCSRFQKTGSLRLTLSQSQGAVSGMLTIDVPSPSSNNDPSLTSATISVTGTVSSAHELSLNGSTVLRETTFGSEVARVAEWTSVLDSNGMTGRITVVTSGFYQGFGSPQTFQITSELHNVLRDAVPR
jgi:hypothetical protein